jgi:phospholipid/cholesterol/gamma-HCH transport system substrate-binding protein
MSYGGPQGLTLYASFDEIGGLKARAPVVISGVKVGQVTDIELNDQFRARATLELDPDLAIPADSSVSIVTSGLLGDRYLSLQIGGEEDVLRSGDEIAFSESAVLLERLIGTFVYNSNRGGGE